jgi:hypothetical protein
MAHRFQPIPANVTFRKIKNSSYPKVCSSFNTSNLAANLYTKESLAGVCVVADSNENLCSPQIPVIDATQSKTAPLYFRYFIDPKGELFGSTPCGVNNYATYMIPSLQTGYNSELYPPKS